VPDILGHSDRLGVVALQDLGDLTLQEHLRHADPPERRRRYEEAAGFIARLQQRGDALASSAYIPYGVSFDAEKLTWELNYFQKHFLEGYRGAALEPADREALAEEWAALAGTLAAEPRVVCHRDYHSRNLMLHDGALFLIDYQDARMGPDTYDLVSLLHDAYVEIHPEEREAHIDRFVSLIGAPDAGAFRRRFTVMTVQRTLKALGTFGYQATVRDNPVYLQYVPRTMGYAREAMARDDRFDRLRSILGRHVPELRCGYNDR
jgi:aminoglycoside/choline kinase family phosphotransferase